MRASALVLSVLSAALTASSPQGASGFAPPSAPAVAVRPSVVSPAPSAGTPKVGRAAAFLLRPMSALAASSEEGGEEADDTEDDAVVADSDGSLGEEEEESLPSADAAAAEEESAPPSPTPGKKTLGLITFDLDDTLYPIDIVLREANLAFASAMADYGFTGIGPSDIDETGRQIRSELSSDNPEASAILSHTEIRMLAIRRQMESIKFTRSLEDVAEDWATTVSGLSPVIVERCRKWASKEVSPSVVQAVYNAWEMERHHAAERNIFPELLEALQAIRDDHPGVVIGAVTDGRANPMLMPFTLAPYFDFCVGWEDDQGGRKKFFTELSRAESDADLTWIYEAALEKGREIASRRSSLGKSKMVGYYDGGEENAVGVGGGIWIHVGDDLAYDVGGSAACGARTILMELDDKYGQTARLMKVGDVPGVALPSKKELENHMSMNDKSRDSVDKTVRFISGLTEAIDDILYET